MERDLAQENAEYLSTLQEYFIVSINQPWLFFAMDFTRVRSSIVRDGNITEVLYEDEFNA